jgi:hypothetical protein
MKRPRECCRMLCNDYKMLYLIREPGARGSLARFDMECIDKKSAQYMLASVGR